MAQMDYDSKTIPFKRGDIRDRNGTVLAASEKVYNLVLDPYVVLNSNGECTKPTAEAIEEFFGIDASEVYKVLDDQPGEPVHRYGERTGLRYGEGLSEFHGF